MQQPRPMVRMHVGRKKGNTRGVLGARPSKGTGFFSAENSAGRGAHWAIPKNWECLITFIEGCKTPEKYKNINCLSQNTGFSNCGI
jgi:hypothetical protein